MDENKPKPKWLDKYDISSPDHINDLETQSAIHEFQHKIPRHEAEKKAYDDYVRERTIEAAAHHLAGMKAAQGAGDMDAARQHGTMYSLALKQLGHPEVGEVPSEIQNHMKHTPSKLYRFKGHDSDSFLAGGKEDKKDNEPTMAKSEDSAAWQAHISKDHPTTDKYLVDRSKCKTCQDFADKVRDHKMAKSVAKVIVEKLLKTKQK